MEARSFYLDLLKFLQVMSPTNHPIHRSTALQPMREHLELSADIDLVPKPHTSRQHSVQVTGPPGYGKATFLKLLVQEAMRDSPNALF